MSEILHRFESPAGVTVVALPFELESVLRDWEQLRSRMVREMAEGFSRDEWAYLITFLDRKNLLGAFEHSFGKVASDASASVSTLVRPRGPIAVWLPNNVSLLGPLTMILLSLTGNALRLKGGSHSEDLTSTFLAFARNNTPDGPLRALLRDRIRLEVFERGDPRHKDLASDAMIRIVFGSDAAAAAIHGLPHPLESVGFSFVDRRSEAWLQSSAVTETVLRDLLKVFAIYGQAGCTSPRRVVLLDFGMEEAVALRDRLVDLWPQVIKREAGVHVASNNVMAHQWARGLSWNSRLAARNAAVIAVGPLGTPEFETTMGLMLVPATMDQAMATLPPNIQTLGYSFADPSDSSWLRVVAQTKIKRLVPLAAMHHFGPVWDGQPYWKGAFEEVELRCL